jgi:hypothetical protein
MTNPQMKPGKSITIIQLIISIVVVLSGAVGLYIKSSVAMAELNLRMQTIEKSQAQWQSNSVARREASDAKEKDQNDHINKNTQDIELLKATKKDK